MWVASDGANSRAQGRTIDTAGTFGARRFLSTAGANACFPRVDVDESGNAYAIWTRDVGGNTRAQGRPVSSTGTLGAITTLSDAGQNAILPAVSIGSASGVAVWARSDGSDTRIQAVAVSPTGATGSVTTLSAARHGATSPQVAADSGGNSQVVWQRSDGSHLRIQERPYAPFAAPEPVQNLSRPGGDAAAPAIAFDPDGGPAIAVWTEPNGGGVQRVRGATGP